MVESVAENRNPLLSVVILATNPPLVVDGCETRGGLVANVDKPQNFPPAGGKSSAKNLVFGRFRANGATIFFRPSAEKFWLRNKGGLVAKGRVFSIHHRSPETVGGNVVSGPQDLLYTAGDV